MCGQVGGEGGEGGQGHGLLDVPERQPSVRKLIKERSEAENVSLRVERRVDQARSTGPEQGPCSFRSRPYPKP